MYKIKESTLDIILLCLTIIRFSFIPNRIFTLAKYMIITYLLIKHYGKIRYNKILYFCFFAYSFVLAYSTSINMKSFTWSLSALMYGLQLMVIFLILSSLCYKIEVYAIVKIIFVYTFIMILINDLSMLIIPYNFLDSEEIYLIGNKFSVSYCHSLFIGLCYILQHDRKRKWFVPASILYSGIIVSIIHCTTGILIISVMTVLFFVPKWVRRIIERPTVVLIAIAVENLLIWGSASIFKHPVLQSIMTNVFHKSPDMTGRTRLYSVVLPLVEQKPLLGYGYNTDIFRDMFGYGNAQNGLFHIIIQAGMIGVILFFAVVFLALSRIKNKELGHGMYAYIYGMIVGSAVEINLSTLFMLGIAILYMCGIAFENSTGNGKRLPDSYSE